MCILEVHDVFPLEGQTVVTCGRMVWLGLLFGVKLHHYK
jgi:hypothetical protein